MDDYEEYSIIDDIPLSEEVIGNKDFRIYYVVGRKVGCTQVTVEERCRRQRLWEGYIVEVLEVIPASFGPRFAGDREWYWADYYGYLRGPHYAEGNLDVIRSEAGKIGGKIGGSIVGRKRADLGKTPLQTMSRERQQELGRKGGTTTSRLGKNPWQTMSKEKRQEITSKGGRASVAMGKSGFQTMSWEKHSEIGSIAGKASAASPNNINKQFLTCPHCNLTGTKPGMMRWHFDNCRFKGLHDPLEEKT